MNVSQAIRSTHIPKHTNIIGLIDYPHPLIVPENISTQQYKK